MAIYAISSITTSNGNRYTAVQYGSHTDLTVTDQFGDMVDYRGSIALPTGVRVGTGFVVDVRGEGSPRPLVVTVPVTSVIEVSLDPSVTAPSIVTELLQFAFV
jgi:hypothetical protein